MQTLQINRCVYCMEDLKDPGVSICPHCGKPPQTVEQPPYGLKPFSILHGKYLVGRMLGQGGFGITYIGHDLLLDAKIAIKEYFPQSQASRDYRVSNHLEWGTTMVRDNQWKSGCESFLKEARKMAKIREIPEIVRVQDTFEENNTAYIVMDFVEGITLKQRLEQSGAMSFQDCVTMLRPVLDALCSVHRQGLIHRDISPDNIMIQSSGRLKLLDLGAAKEIENHNEGTSQLVAKRGFSPFEQYTTGGEIGPWTDVYSMCVTMYYCVTGRMPPDALERIDRDTLSFEDFPFTPEEIEVLRKGMAIRGRDRYQTMDELMTAALAVISAPAPAVQPQPAPAQPVTPEPVQPVASPEPVAPPEPAEPVMPPPEPPQPAAPPKPASEAGKAAAPQLKRRLPDILIALIAMACPIVSVLVLVGLSYAIYNAWGYWYAVDAIYCWVSCILAGVVLWLLLKFYSHLSLGIIFIPSVLMAVVPGVIHYCIYNEILYRSSYRLWVLSVCIQILMVSLLPALLVWAVFKMFSNQSNRTITISSIAAIAALAIGIRFFGVPWIAIYAVISTLVFWLVLRMGHKRKQGDK